MSEIVLADAPGDGVLSLKGVRRCRGCVSCLTATPGACAISDSFSAEIPVILAADRLIIEVDAGSGRVPADIMKAVERLSNILEAYTDSGGNVPLPMESARLREIVFRVAGRVDDRDFEDEMVKNLRKGPVETVSFEYN